MPGNKIAIVAPSSPFNAQELQNGIDTISAMGLYPVLGPNVKNLRVRTIHSASAQDRANELMWAFSNPDISAVLCVRGGYGSAEVLPLLDYDVITRNKKVFIGKSDATAVINGMYAKTGIVSICGRTASIRSEFLDQDMQSLEHTLKLCMSNTPWGEEPFALSNITPRTVSPGKAQGHAIGGNLETLCTLIGTEYFPDPSGAILFIEDVHKGGTSIARKLLHLKMTGVLSAVSGIVIGEFFDIPKKMSPESPSIEDVILEYLSSGPPCVYGYSFSHGEYTCPIPVGAQVNLDADFRTLSFDFSMAR